MLRLTLHRSLALAASALVLAGLVATMAPPARAATASVDVGDGAFGPATLTIAAGDTVTWTNVDDSPHTVTATGGAFDSGNLDPGQTFSQTFTSPGTYAYVCTYHSGMNGTITVAAATAPSTAPATSPPATAGAAGQPNTALSAPSTLAPWIPGVLIGLGLVALAFGVVPPVARRTAPRRTSVDLTDRNGGWRR